MSRYPSALIAASAATVLLAGPALPQSAANDLLNAFSSGGDQLSNEFLSRIFGCRLFPTGGDCSARPVPIFAQAIGLFNSFCLALGLALFSFNASTGIMQTAHEGQVLGARWNSLWAPIRTIGAAAMLTPLPGLDGYNTVQTAIAWLVRGSTAAASVIWAASADLIIDHQAPITNPAVMFDQQVVGATWQMASCQAVVQRLMHEQKIGSELKVSLSRPPPRDVRFRQGRRPGEDSAMPAPPVIGTAGAAASFQICGQLRLPEPPAIVVERGRLNEWNERHGEALTDLLGNMRVLADQMIEAETTDPASPVPGETAAYIINAGEAYAQDLGSWLPGFAKASGIAAGDSVAARDRIKLIVAGSYSDTCDNQTSGDAWMDSICDASNSGQGWLAAGAWYMHMARFANEATALFNARPQPDNPVVISEATASERRSHFGLWARISGFFSLDSGFLGSDRSEGRLRQRAEELAAGVDRRWNEAILIAATQGGEVDSQLIQGAFAGEGMAGSVLPSNAVRNWMAAKTTEWFLPPATVDPMASLAEFGNAQLAWGLALIAGGKAAEFASGLVALLPVAGIAETLGGAAVVIGGALMVSGAFLAFILPLLPFLLWTAAVTGYFLLVAEAVIATNLWAVAHLRLDGEGLAGNAAQQGYYLVLALTLTPVLMVFGFLLGMGIFKVTSTLIGIGIDVALRGLAHDQSWAVWLVGMAVVAIILVIVYVVLAERSFSLVAELPGKVLRWVGADANVTSREDERIRATALAGAAAIGTAAGRLNPRLGRRSGRNGEGPKKQ